MFTAIKNLPFQFWTLYIQALLVPSYRPEWGSFIQWDPHIPPPTRNDLEKRKRRRKRRCNPKSKSKQSQTSMARKANPLPTPTPHDHTECLTIRINVSGQIFEPQIRTLKQFPKTLLGNRKRMMQYYDPVHDEFFFDRNRTCFEAILLYYQTGGITRQPPSTPLDVFITEAKFFEMDDIVTSLESIQGIGPEEEKPLPKNLFQRKLWLLFEYPESSFQARIVAYCSVFVVCLSIFEFCCETVPTFKWGSKEDENRRSEGTKPTDYVGAEGLHDLKDPFFLTETLCVIFFVFEFLARAITCPRPLGFVKDLSNIIDLVAILPFFFSLMYSYQGVDTDAMSDISIFLADAEDLHDDLDDGHDHNHQHGQPPTIPHATFRREEDQGKSASINKAMSLTMLRVIRLVRVFRIFKLSRHNRGLKILGKTLRASLRELGLLASFLLMGVVVFSSAVFLTETHSEDTEFTSIPSGFWFGIITMTTLGYGDIVPESPTGKIVGSLCAIAGVLTISLPVPVIVSNFNMFYNQEINKEGAEAESDSLLVEHCPFYPGWYSANGEIIDGGVDPTQSAALTWLLGENQADLSDSDFEDLKQDSCLKADRGRRRSSQSSRRGSKRTGAAKVSFKI